MSKTTPGQDVLALVGAVYVDPVTGAAVCDLITFPRFAPPAWVQAREGTEPGSFRFPDRLSFAVI